MEDKLRLLSLIILAACITMSKDALAQTATFRFSPPDEIAFTETKERRFITEVVGVRQKQVREETGTSSWNIQKHDGQWLFIERNGPMTARINGKPFDTPANKLVAGLIVTNTISSGGKVVQIRFDKDVLREAKRIFPTNYHALLEKELVKKDAVGGAQ